MSMKINIRAITRSSKNRIEPQPDNSLKVWLKTAPVENKANQELIKMLSDYYKVPKTALNIVKGSTGRYKIVEF